MIKLKHRDVDTVAHISASPRRFKEDTFAVRLKKAREALELTQDELGKLINLSRASVAQWERGNNDPRLENIPEIAKALKVRPEYLAFGVTTEPVEVMPSPEALGYVMVPEISIGNSLDDIERVQTWGIPTNWLRTELHCTDFDKLVLYKVEVDSDALQFGDRVIIDRSQTRASPPGQFLYWDGVGPMIAHILIIPGAGNKKPQARVTTASGSYEVAADSVQIIGRVRGIWRKA